VHFVYYKQAADLFASGTPLARRALAPDCGQETTVEQHHEALDRFSIELDLAVAVCKRNAD